jgi:hypothetical protein
MPAYCLHVSEVEVLVARLFKVRRINPPYFWGALDSVSVEFVRFENAECTGWFNA